MSPLQMPGNQRFKSVTFDKVGVFRTGIVSVSMFGDLRKYAYFGREIFVVSVVL